MISLGIMLLLTTQLSSGVDILTVDQAVQIALENNRELRNAIVEARKTDFRISVTRSQMLPAISLRAIGSQELSPIDFTFKRGLLGVFPGTGPIPANDTRVRTPLVPTGLLVTQIAQPITTLRRIRLNAGLLGFNGKVASEQVRAKRQDIVREVRRLYYAIQQAESSSRALDEAVNLYRETVALTSRYVSEQVVLRGDNLTAQTRLAQSEEELVKLHDEADSRKEQLNSLMGRDILTAFSVTPVLEGAAGEEFSIEVARERALEQRTEIRQARLRLEAAEQDRRIQESQRIPDVTANLTSIRTLNYNTFVPQVLNSVGITVTWEPFDWGRKKSQLAEKDLAIEQAHNSLADAQSQVVIDVNDKFRKLRETRGQLRVAQLSRQASEENFRVIQEKFSVQASLVKDVLAGQASLEQAGSDYRQALLSYWNARTEFEKALGEEP
jgi:outer membrane protein TolC